MGPSDRLDDRQRGPTEVARGGAASLAGKRATVCDNKNRSGSGGPERGKETRACCEQDEEAPVASDADMVDQEQTGGEKPVS